MSTTVNFEKIRHNLESNTNIVFALVFGSAVSGNFNKLSDLDIGVYTFNEPSLLEIGRMVTGLEKIVKKNVDLVILNDLYKKKPNFANEVMKTARLLFTRDEGLFVNYKTKVLLYYLDVKPLLDMNRAALERRIKSGRFGDRNFTW